ncbi:MAG: alpha/beta hydrolase [Hyphomonadaceae bacterium]|nr:alpha/beta hydrolase [Hyphomonadaceae bacterium]
MKVRWLAAICLLLVMALVYSGSPALAQDGEQLTVDSSMGDLLDNPTAREILEREIPVLATNPQIRQANGVALRALQAYLPAQLTNETLAAVNRQLLESGARRQPGAGAHPVQAVVDARAALQLETIRLWEGRAPGATGDAPTDTPTLTIVAPDGATNFGSAVIVAPGGGYQALATGHEGRQVADWFAAHGVTAFVLTYRLTPSGYSHPAQLDDARRAIRWVRAHASEYGIDPNRIGMIGFSAGGHLTAMASTISEDGDPQALDPVERVSSKLDFAAVIYAPTMIDASTALGEALSRALAGRWPSAQTRRQLNPAQNVTENTPPTFLLYTSTDPVVPPRHGTAYYDALREHGVPAELHVFADGRHGLGLAMGDATLSAWPQLLATWLRERGIVGTPE